MSSTSVSSAATPVEGSGPDLPLIEIGVVLAGWLDELDREAVEAARQSCRRQLDEWLPEFEWRVVVAPRNEMGVKRRIEPVELLQRSVEERDRHGWDFTIVITSAELASHYKPFALAVLSRSLDTAVISTSRIDPRAEDAEATKQRRLETIAAGLETLMMHTFGHLCGLSHAADNANLMHDIESIDDLVGMRDLNDDQKHALRSMLADIADERLEERERAASHWNLGFLLQAGWLNRHEIVDAVRQAKPWEFPVRLSRLTTAGVSTLLVLLMTAETWDMAMSQSMGNVIALMAAALVLTTGYVAVRQQLLIRRYAGHLSEQIVVSNLSALAIVFSGMLITYCVLFLLALTASTLIFPTPVVIGWAAAVDERLAARHYFLLSQVVATLGLLIGALGASFEEQHHFRHVVFVDEET